MALPMLQQMKQVMFQNHANILDELEARYSQQINELLNQKRLIISQIQQSFIKQLNNINNIIDQQTNKMCHETIQINNNLNTLFRAHSITNSSQLQSTSNIDTQYTISLPPLIPSLNLINIDDEIYKMKSRLQRKRKFNEVSPSENEENINILPYSSRHITKKCAKKTNLTNMVQKSDNDIDDDDDGVYNGNKCCLCKQESNGNMIQCDNKVCSNKLFHWKCARIHTKPKYKWYCMKCRRYSTKSNRLAPKFVNDQ